MRHSHLLDRVKEQAITYRKILKWKTGKEQDVVPPCIKELVQLVRPDIPITEEEIMEAWPLEGYLLAD